MRLKMAKVKFYYVAECNENDQLLAFFNGTDYTDNPALMKIFTETDLQDARREAGDHQRYNLKTVTQVLNFTADVPDAVKVEPEPVPTPPTDTPPVEDQPEKAAP